jgi:hypothetical protein
MSTGTGGLTPWLRISSNCLKYSYYTLRTGRSPVAGEQVGLPTQADQHLLKLLKGRLGSWWVSNDDYVVTLHQVEQQALDGGAQTAFDLVTHHRSADRAAHHESIPAVGKS